MRTICKEKNKKSLFNCCLLSFGVVLLFSMPSRFTVAITAVTSLFGDAPSDWKPSPTLFRHVHTQTDYKWYPAYIILQYKIWHIMALNHILWASFWPFSLGFQKRLNAKWEHIYWEWYSRSILGRGCHFWRVAYGSCHYLSTVNSSVTTCKRQMPI